MIPSAAAHIVLPLIVAVSIMLMLIRPHGIPEVYRSCRGFRLLFLRVREVGLIDDHAGFCGLPLGT
jgi:hypothetical protein